MELFRWETGAPTGILYFQVKCEVLRTNVCRCNSWYFSRENCFNCTTQWWIFFAMNFPFPAPAFNCCYAGLVLAWAFKFLAFIPCCSEYLLNWFANYCMQSFLSNLPAILSICKAVQFLNYMDRASWLLERVCSVYTRPQPDRIM